MTTVWVFPGQGSQRKGMGAELFERFPQHVREADELLGYSIRALCLDDPDGKLKRTEYTQPALFVVSALAFLAKREQAAAPPEVYAGHSLGEFNALFAAGAFDFRTGVALVRERGRLMAQAPRGAMAAILGLAPDQVRAVLAASPFDGIDIANLNSAAQTVISGLYEDIERCEPLFAQAGARYVRLNVGAAFHSRYLREVERQFADYVAGHTFEPLTAQVIANCTARPYPASDYQGLLTRQITQPVKWHESISWLLSRGPVELEEVGPGDVLTQLFFKIRQAPLAIQTDGAAAPATPRTVFMYSGQGSQYYRMGQELYRQHASFRAAMERCDALYRAHTGRGMLAELYGDEPRRDELTDVLLSHPALFSLGYSLTQVLLDAGIAPDGVLGYSLGEYIAATVAGALSLEDAMALVVGQARSLSERASGGGMLTVLAAPEHFERHPELYAGTTLASVNFAGNFVVSGPHASLAALKTRLDEMSIVSLLLPVEHAFHSAAMDAIETDFRAAVAKLPQQAPRLPIYSAMRGAAVETVDTQYLWEVIRQPVDFRQLMDGLSAEPGIRFVDLGPSGSLSGFIKHGYGQRVEHAASINPFGRNLETLSRLLSQLSSTRHITAGH